AASPTSSLRLFVSPSLPRDIRLQIMDRVAQVPSLRGVEVADGDHAGEAARIVEDGDVADAALVHQRAEVAEAGRGLARQNVGGHDLEYGRRRGRALAGDDAGENVALGDDPD